MKRFIFITLAVILMVACNNRSDADKNFDWLLGSWERSNEKEGRQTIEIWNKRSSIEYTGFGAILEDGDTLWYEHIKLVKSDTTWNFEVTGQGETTPTIFKLSSIEKGRFTSENDLNEFPKKIEYYISGDSLKALISGGDMEIQFDFASIKP